MKSVFCRRSLYAIFALFFCIGCASVLQAKVRKPKPKKKTTATIVFEQYPALQGGADHPENLAGENEVADLHRLPRITDEDIEEKIESEFLVCVPKRSHYFTADIPDGRRYLSPEALRYLWALARAFSERFSMPKRQRLLKVTSLVRTEEYQQWLAGKSPNGRRKRVRNANAATGDTPETRSVHPTGYAFDIGTKKMKQEEILWLAGFLAADAAKGGVLAIYEHKAQQDFHVFVIPQTQP